MVFSNSPISPNRNLRQCDASLGNFQCNGPPVQFATSKLEKHPDLGQKSWSGEFALGAAFRTLSARQRFCAGDWKKVSNAPVADRERHALAVLQFGFKADRIYQSTFGSMSAIESQVQLIVATLDAKSSSVCAKRFAQKAIP